MFFLLKGNTVFSSDYLKRLSLCCFECLVFMVTYKSHEKLDGLYV